MADTALEQAQPTIEARPPSRWKKALAAGFLSLFVPGWGQLYNRQPRKALYLAVPIPILLVLVVKTRMLFAFLSMVAAFTFLTGWRLFIAAEASRSGFAPEKPESSVPRPRLTYTLLTVVLLVAAVYPSTDQFKRWTSFAAFKVPSSSMCPTICPGERVVADMAAYRHQSPQRGDLVILGGESFPALFLKRVIGTPGDLVEPGPDGRILVNGKPLILPTVCGKPFQANDPGDYPIFDPTKVPEGALFVIGDNLANSFDSRISQFPRVVPDSVRGKPVYLYWSTGHSRIGCPTR
jgi:signal peptidase I